MPIEQAYDGTEYVYDDHKQDVDDYLELQDVRIAELKGELAQAYLQRDRAYEDHDRLLERIQALLLERSEARAVARRYYRAWKHLKEQGYQTHSVYRTPDYIVDTLRKSMRR